MLLGLMLLASGSANALSLNCQRTVESHDAFSTIQAFDSWFPKTIRPNKADRIPTSKDTQVRFQIKGAIYDLTPSKWMVGKLPEKGGYKSVTGVRYKCNASSHAVKLALQKNSESSGGSTQSATAGNVNRFPQLADSGLCNFATRQGRWEKQIAYLPYVQEAKHRGLTCGVGESDSTNDTTQVASMGTSSSNQRQNFYSISDGSLCVYAVRSGTWDTRPRYIPYVVEAKHRGLTCGLGDSGSTQKVNANWATKMTDLTNAVVCQKATLPSTFGGWQPINGAMGKYVVEAKRRGLTCGVDESGSTQIAAAPKPSVSSAELTAAQLQTEAERQKRIQLERELAALKAEKEQQKVIIAADKQVPLITITQSGTDQRKGIIRGFARDNVQVAEVLIDGNVVIVGSDGSFKWSGFVPATGKDIIIEAIDTAALSSSKIVRLERGQIQQASGPRFDDLDPTAGKRVKRNENALALIVGISDYERTDAPAIYADKDAQYFHDYASLKLGIPDSNITIMINEKAEQGDVILAVKDWMRRSSKPGKSDVYIFFAGHGLASQDGEQMYLLPFDGRPRLLDETAILREKLFDDIAAANPRSVTAFLDTCYSGTTRGPEMLIASRPISIRAKESAIPEGFTVMTAAAGDQTAKPLEEAKHGMFSYFLMKGMEGDADTNQDNQITAGELHAYVQKKVIQQSSGSQTPELQGDAERVLVRFQ